MKYKNTCGERFKSLQYGITALIIVLSAECSGGSIGGSVELPFARMHNVNYLLCISDNICQNLAGYCSHRMLYVGILEAVYKLLLKFCKGEGYGTVYNSHGSRHLMNKFFCPFLQTPSQIPRSTIVKLSHTGFCLPEG